MDFFFFALFYHVSFYKGFYIPNWPFPLPDFYRYNKKYYNCALGLPRHPRFFSDSPTSLIKSRITHIFRKKSTGEFYAIIIKIEWIFNAWIVFIHEIRVMAFGLKYISVKMNSLVDPENHIYIFWHFCHLCIDTHTYDKNAKQQLWWKKDILSFILQFAGFDIFAFQQFLTYTPGSFTCIKENWKWYQIIDMYSYISENESFNENEIGFSTKNPIRGKSSS